MHRDLRLSATSAAAFLALVSGRRGHFLLESGYHGGLWLDLDPLFCDPPSLQPFVAALADGLRPYGAEVVCGPLLGGAFLAQLVARELGAAFCFTERVPAPPADGLYRARYRLPPGLAARVRGKRVAMVDDVMSAGSSLRATWEELRTHGGIPVAAGALLVLGSAGADFFAERGIPVAAAARDEYRLWSPEDCPLCADGVPLKDVASPSS